MFLFDSYVYQHILILLESQFDKRFIVTFSKQQQQEFIETSKFLLLRSSEAGVGEEFT